MQFIEVGKTKITRKYIEDSIKKGYDRQTIIMTVEHIKFNQDKINQMVQEGYIYSPKENFIYEGELYAFLYYPQIEVLMSELIKKFDD